MFLSRYGNLGHSYYYTVSWNDCRLSRLKDNSHAKDVLHVLESPFWQAPDHQDGLANDEMITKKYWSKKAGLHFSAVRRAGAAPWLPLANIPE